jgi:hypothetical protein
VPELRRAGDEGIDRPESERRAGPSGHHRLRPKAKLNVLSGVTVALVILWLVYAMESRLPRGCKWASGSVSVPGFTLGNNPMNEDQWTKLMGDAFAGSRPARAASRLPATSVTPAT